MSEKIQRLRGSVLALIAAGFAVAAIVLNLVHSGKIMWGGLIVLLLALIVWQRRGQNADGA